MLKSLLLLTLLATAPAFSQTVLTTPQVLGCSNPAPAVPPAATVWLPSGCTTPAFMPLNTASVVASVSKTSPVWQHTLTGYSATTLIVACPSGATVLGASCTLNGADASALVAESAVASLAVTPPPPPPPAPVNITITLPGIPSVTWQNVPSGSCFSLTDGTHTIQSCLPTS